MTTEQYKYEALPGAVSIDDEAEQQYSSALNQIVRKYLYNAYAVPPIGWIENGQKFYGIDGEIVNALELEGQETLVDIGCGDGNFIELLANVCGHEGTLIGINNDASHYLAIETDFADNPSVHFLEEDARDIPLPNESVDCVTMKFLRYHLDNPDKALDEALRILKPGGKLLIATRNPGNQARLWSFMEDITDELKKMTLAGETDATSYDRSGNILTRIDYTNTQPPETFYQRDDIDNVKSALTSRGLDVATEYMQSSALGNSFLQLPGSESNETIKDAWYWYNTALYGLQTAFRGTIPSHTDLKTAIDRRVKHIFANEVLDKGFFTEYVEQGFVIAQKAA